MLLSNMRELREKLNLSQADVARELNISRQAYNFYENKKRDPDTETLIKLADLFNVSLDELLGRSHTTADNTMALSDKEVEMIKGMRNESEIDADMQQYYNYLVSKKLQKKAAEE